MTAGNYNNGDDSKVKGDDGSIEGALISSVVDGSTIRLAVDTKITAVSAGNIPSWLPNVRYEDMNASNGGVARDTAIGSTFTTIYDKTGVGRLVGFLINNENPWDEWEIKLIIDTTNTIFTLNTKTLENTSLYGYKTGGGSDNNHLGVDLSNNTFRWRGPLLIPMAYTARIQVQVRYIKGGTKKFRAGLVTRTV